MSQAARHRRARAVIALGLVAASLGGCAAAMIPAAVSTMVVSKKMAAARDRRAEARATTAPLAPSTQADASQSQVGQAPVGQAQPSQAQSSQTQPSQVQSRQAEPAPAQLTTAAGQAAVRELEAQGGITVVKGMTDLPPPSGAPAAVPSRAAPVTPLAVPSGPAGANPPPGMQFLYGSGEAAANSRQAYGALARYLQDFKYRRADSLRQLVISDGATLAAPYFEPCGKKPTAIVLDIDETALLNLGYEANDARYGLGFSDARWQRWEASGATAVAVVPGAKDVIDQARKAGVTVIFNSNRSAANAAATEAALDGAGLGPVKHGQTLWLKGDDGGGSAKDDRRWAIATGYCVIALVGDQLGDFSDLFNDPALNPAQRRAATATPGIAELWGNGWFVLPNPVYGTALKGGLDDIFPTDRRWTDPGPAANPAKE